MDSDYYSYHHLPDFPSEATTGEEMAQKPVVAFHRSSPEFFNLSDLLLPLPPPPPPSSSGAFLPYVKDQHHAFLEFRTGSSSKNVLKRVIELLRHIPVPITKRQSIESSPSSGSRRFLHMMRERRRRERQSQSYADLYSIIFPKPKPDKTSIVRSSAEFLKNLKATEARLTRQNQELKSRIEEVGFPASEIGRNEIKLSLDNPTSSIDSMIVALQRLKGKHANARTIRSHISDGEQLVEIGIDEKFSM